MKLYQAAASPYARKVRISAHELGLADRIKLVPISPQGDESYGKVNPIHRVPALELDDGLVLYDSRVICEYLDSISGNKLFPTTGVARFQALKQQALADGLCDAAVPRRQEMLRPAAQQSPDFLKTRERMMRQVLDTLEGMVDQLSGVTIGTIAVSCALAYMDFRFADDNWRQGRPKLAEWYKAWETRPSVVATPSG